MDKLPHHDIEILPSLNFKDPRQMKEKAQQYQQQTTHMHVDFADGLFVPNTLPNVDQVRRFSIQAKLEAHFMVARPANWIGQALTDDRFQTIVIHIEASGDIASYLDQISKAGRQAALALKPTTPVEQLKPYLPQLDQVTVMTVDPGFNGSPFIEQTLEKVTQIRQLAPNLTIECDGGINPRTAVAAIRAGANRLVVGSYFHNVPLRDGLRAINDSIDSQLSNK